MDDTFPFLRLPDLVKCEVMRRLSTVQKARTLGNMPEFDSLLSESMCWNDGSRPSSELVRSIRSIRDGFYSSADSRHVFRVSASRGETLTVRIFNTKRTLLEGLDCWKRGRVRIVEPTSKLVEFLNRLVDECTYAESLPANRRRHDRWGRFFVDYLTRSIVWTEVPNAPNVVLSPIGVGDYCEVFDPFRCLCYEMALMPFGGRRSPCGSTAVCSNAVDVEFRLIREDESVSIDFRECYRDCRYAHYLECDLLKMFDFSTKKILTF